jgi:hypothetical protein
MLILLDLEETLAISMVHPRKALTVGPEVKLEEKHHGAETRLAWKSMTLLADLMYKSIGKRNYKSMALSLYLCIMDRVSVNWLVQARTMQKVGHIER